MLLICPACHAPIKVQDSLEKQLKNVECAVCDTKAEIERVKATPFFETDIYKLYGTSVGWYADAEYNSYEWFDYPEIRFDRDLLPCFRLQPEFLEGRVDLDVYRSFLDVLDSQIVELTDFIKEYGNA